MPATGPLSPKGRQQGVAMRATLARAGRLMMPGIAALILTAGSWGAGAAPAAAGTQAPAARCPITFIGMHGLNEDLTSPVLHSFWDEYVRRVPDRSRLGNPVFLGHPRQSGTEFLHRLQYGNPAPDDPVEVGFRFLSNQVASTVQQCSPARLVLVGYSAGAWSIDKWLRTRPYLHSQVLGVELFGDPQWDHGPQGQGLARRYRQTVSGPYVPASLADRFQSWCTSGDPICGQGYGPGRHESARQKGAALRMFTGGPCFEHCQSYKYGATARGAQFLARLSNG